MPAPAKRPDVIVHSEEPDNAEPPRTALSGPQITPVDAFHCWA